jgi:hypothetical protein
MKKRILNGTYGALLGSVVCLLWLPFETAIGIFVASVLSHIAIEILEKP